MTKGLDEKLYNVQHELHNYEAILLGVFECVLGFRARREKRTVLGFIIRDVRRGLIYVVMLQSDNYFFTLRPH